MVLENFAIGNAFILDTRVRMTSLFAAMEMLYQGSLAQTCSAGTRFSALIDGYGLGAEDPVSTIDKDWPKVRNNVLHAGAFYEEADVAALKLIVRLALWAAVRLASEEETEPLKKLKRLLDGAYLGHADSLDRIATLCSFE